MKTLKLNNVAIWKHQNLANGIAIRIGGKLTSVNNIEGSVRCHKNLYAKLEELLEQNE